MQDNIKSLIDRTQTKYSSNTFNPQDAHRRAKSAFWAHFFQSGTLPPANIDIAVAVRFSGFSEVSEWWSIPGFPEWFQNGEEFRQRVEYVSNLALDVLYTVLSDGAARTGDKLAAAKMALEIASKFPKSAPKEQYADEQIAGMSTKELEEFIGRKLKVINISTSDNKTIDTVTNTRDTSTDS